MKDYECKENIEQKYHKCTNCQSTNITVQYNENESNNYEILCGECKSLYGGIITSHGTVIECYSRVTPNIILMEKEN